jgi:hypothetical protein
MAFVSEKKNLKQDKQLRILYVLMGESPIPYTLIIYILSTQISENFDMFSVIMALILTGFIIHQLIFIFEPGLTWKAFSKN